MDQNGVTTKVYWSTAEVDPVGAQAFPSMHILEGSGLQNFIAMIYSD
jgi:hypothetical protein